MRQIRAALVAAFFMSAQAFAQQVCVPRDQAVRWLEQQFGERPLGRGLTDDGRAMFELFTDDKGESWTILVVPPKGPACVIAAGKDWRWRSSKRKEPKA